MPAKLHGHHAAATRRLVQLLLRHPLVADTRGELRLVLWVVPPASTPQARRSVMGASPGADRAAAVIDATGWRCLGSGRPTVVHRTSS